MRRLVGRVVTELSEFDRFIYITGSNSMNGGGLHHAPPSLSRAMHLRLRKPSAFLLEIAD